MDNFPFSSIEELSQATLKDAEFLNNPNAEPRIFKVSAMISRIMADRPLFYESCPECKKKVTPNDHSNGFYCVRCQKAFEKCKYAYNFTTRIADFSGHVYVSALGDQGDSLIGMTAEKLRESFDLKDPQA